MRKSLLCGLAAAAVLAPCCLPSGAAQAAPVDCGSGGATIGYTYTGTIITCAIVSGGTYSLTAFGANGGDQRIDNLTPTQFGGKGAEISGTFLLATGDILRILVGGVGQTHAGEMLADEIYPGGGGGGTFIAIQAGGNGAFEALLVAGGGGGAGTDSNGYAGRAIEGNSGVPNGNGQYGNAGAGGANGGGGGAADTATGGAGGGGFSGDGGTGPSSGGGASFLDGGAGGIANAAKNCLGASGGFGGGGGAAWSDCTQSGGAGGGGGGGYSGGGGGGWEFWGNDGGAGGGGSSFYDVRYFTSPVTATAGANPFADGNGQVLLQQLTRDDGTPVPVPEPGSLALLGGGLLGLVAARRRRGR